MAKPRGTFRPFRKPGKPEPLGDVLARWLDQTGIMRPTVGDRLRAAWNEIVGAEIAAAAEPTGFRGGVLTVTVTNSPLLQELSGFRAAELSASINAKIKGVYVSRIRCRVGRLPREKPS
jgi:predicted nucleic acid-binding Zn ribbon protein